MDKQRALGLQQRIDAVNKAISDVVRWFTLVMVLLTFVIVLLRYGFNLGWIAMQESVLYLHAAVLLLGAARTLQVNQHVRVDIIYRTMSERKKALIDLLGTLVFLMPVNLFIVIFSWRYVSTSWRVLERSGEAGGLPLVFALKSLILLFALMMFLQGIAQVIKHSHTLAQGESR